MTGRSAGAWPLKVIIHAGPHKTGTTSVQTLVEEHRDFLVSRGIFVPERRDASLVGHHVIACLVMDISLAKLGVREAGQSLDKILGDWFAAARNARADQLFISAELFSFMDEQQWRDLESTLQSAADHSGVFVTRFTVHVTDREMSSRLRSLAAEIVNQGATAPMSELVEFFATYIPGRDRVIAALPQILATETTVSRIPLEGDAFTRRWFGHVFGSDVANELPSLAQEIQLNQAKSPETLEEIRLFSVLNNPDGADPVFPFHRNFDDTPGLAGANARLFMVRPVFRVRDAYRAEREAQEPVVQGLRAEFARLSDRRLRARLRRLLLGR